jgi:hypothetical protein
MRLSFGKWCLEFWSKTFTGESDITAEADILLYESKSNAKVHSQINIFGCAVSQSPFRIAILSQGHGATPHVFPLPETDTILLGFDRKAVGIDIPSRHQLFEYELETLSHTFLYSPSTGVVLAIHEIGVLALSKKGQPLWKFARDIITEAVMSPDSLRLSFMDSPSAVLRLQDGKILE